MTGRDAGMTSSLVTLEGTRFAEKLKSKKLKSKKLKSLNRDNMKQALLCV